VLDVNTELVRSAPAKLTLVRLVFWMVTPLGVCGTVGRWHTAGIESVSGPWFSTQAIWELSISQPRGAAHTNSGHGVGSLQQLSGGKPQCGSDASYRNLVPSNVTLNRLAPANTLRLTEDVESNDAPEKSAPTRSKADRHDDCLNWAPWKLAPDA